MVPRSLWWVLRLLIGSYHKPKTVSRSSVSNTFPRSCILLSFERQLDFMEILPRKLIISQWIMGMAGFKTAWQRQTKDFGHGQNTNRDQSTKYSCLIFDNRGVGESDKPLMRYSTSEMAMDTLELIDHLGWTSERQLHVIGSSLGGMIGQELVSIAFQLYEKRAYLAQMQALMVPDRIASFTLISTAPRLFSTIVSIRSRTLGRSFADSFKGWFQNLRDRINMLFASLSVKFLAADAQPLTLAL